MFDRAVGPGHPTGRSRLPDRQTFSAWEPALSSIPAPTQAALRTLEWVQRCENLVVCGPSGTGKTFFLEALGQLGVCLRCSADHNMLRSVECF